MDTFPDYLCQGIKMLFLAVQQIFLLFFYIAWRRCSSYIWTELASLNGVQNELMYQQNNWEKAERSVIDLVTQM